MGVSFNYYSGYNCVLALTIKKMDAGFKELAINDQTITKKTFTNLDSNSHIVAIGNYFFLAGHSQSRTGKDIAGTCCGTAAGYTLNKRHG